MDSAPGLLTLKKSGIIQLGSDSVSWAILILSFLEGGVLLTW